MNDLPIHLVLFVVIGVAIVTMGAFYAEADDRIALRSLPRRLGSFFGGCALLVIVMLICEHTFAALQ